MAIFHFLIFSRLNNQNIIVTINDNGNSSLQDKFSVTQIWQRFVDYCIILFATEIIIPFGDTLV